MADLERRMQVADNAVSHVHVTLQGQIGAYNQEWQGERRKAQTCTLSILGTWTVYWNKPTHTLIGMAAYFRSTDTMPTA